MVHSQGLLSSLDGQARQQTILGGSAGDEYLSDSYDLKEIEDGFFFEVEGKVLPGVPASDSAQVYR